MPELILATWIFIAALVTAGLLCAFYVSNINDIWVWIIMSLGGGLMVPLLLRFYWWRFNGNGFAIGCIVGMLAAIAQRVFTPWVGQSYRFLTTEPWSLVTLGLIGLVASVVGSLLTKPTPEPVLRNFYLTTLPFGFWSKYKNELPDPLRERVATEHRREITAIPFALTYQVMIFLAADAFFNSQQLRRTHLYPGSSCRAGRPLLDLAPPHPPLRRKRPRRARLSPSQEITHSVPLPPSSLASLP